MHQFIHFQLFNSILFSKMHIVILDKWVVQNDRKENVTSSKIELLHFLTLTDVFLASTGANFLCKTDTDYLRVEPL